jgi:iron complex outermembrane receptor protein
LGAGGPLGTSGGHYRIDYSLNHSDGFIERDDRQLHNLTTALAWDFGAKVDVQVSFDVQHDDIDVSYWGTPLVPTGSALDPIEGVVATPDNRTVDRAMSRINYNAGDGVTRLTNRWTQARLQWRPAPGILVRNDVYHTHSDREWKNAEAYSFDPTTDLIERDRFFVSHGVSLTGNRLAVSAKRPLGGFANSFLAGLDVSSMEFLRVPRYRGGVDFVDRFNSSPGVFGPLQPQSYTTQDVNTQAFFVEDYFSLRSDLKVALSARGERIDADHGSFDFAPGQSVTKNPSGGTPVAEEMFGRVFTPFTWKAGLIYDTRANLSLYGHVATSANPADSDLVFGVADFDLATGRQVEVGARQTLFRGAEWTAAYYWLERRNVLTQTGPETSAPVGRQSTRGVELSFGIRPVERWRLRATAAFLNPRYDDFKEVIDDVLVSRDGFRPPNSPKAVLDFQTSVRLGSRIPVEIGGSHHYVGDRFNGLDNSVSMLGYGVTDGFAAVTIGRSRITGRVRNLFDVDYANWGSQFYSTQVSLGAPRSAEIDLSVRF